jgi:hypothetical protein
MAQNSKAIKARERAWYNKLTKWNNGCYFLSCLLPPRHAGDLSTSGRAVHCSGVRAKKMTTNTTQYVTEIEGNGK